jgi:Tfp pilus assembly protein PilF
MQLFLKLVLIATLLGAGAAGVMYHKDITTFVETQLIENEAKQALASENSPQAILLYEKGVKDYPSHYHFSTALAALYQQQGALNRAEALYKKVLENDVKNMEARIGYAKFLMQDPQRLNEAVKQCREALRFHKGDPRLLMTLGDLYKQAGENPAETREKIKQWLFDWAIYYYRIALRNDPNLFQPRFNLAVIYQELEKPESAAIHYCNAILLAPDSYEARYNLGLALVSLHAYDEGYRQLAQAIQILSDQNRMADAQTLAEHVQAVKNSVFSFGESSGLKTVEPPNTLNPSCLLDKKPAQASK